MKKRELLDLSEPSAGQMAFTQRQYVRIGAEDVQVHQRHQADVAAGQSDGTKNRR